MARRPVRGKRSMAVSSEPLPGGASAPLHGGARQMVERSGGAPRHALRRALVRKSLGEATWPKRADKLTSRDVPARRVDRLARCCHAGLTFELTRPERTGAWAARRMIDSERFAAQAAGRGGSRVERGVRRHRSPT